MKHVVVTGASGAIGQSISAAFISKGWKVTGLIGPNDRTLHPDVIYIHCDLTDAVQVENALQSMALSPSAIIHTVGGIAPAASVDETSVDAALSMITLNYITSYNIARAGIARMKPSGGGSIVMIGAQDVLHPKPNRSAYASSKAAVTQLVSSIAEEGREFNIRANAILPSIVRTPANLSWAENGEEEKWITPEHIAHACLFLTDTDCGVSGALLPMYGKLPY